MRSKTITNKHSIEQYLLNFPNLNYYHIGDLDDFFWPHTTWYANKKEKDINAICLLYSGFEPPSFLCIFNENKTEMEELIIDIIPSLPDEFYAHFSPGLEDLFEPYYQLEHHGEYEKMYVDKADFIEFPDRKPAENLTSSNLSETQEFFDKAYPGNWFGSRMLETGQYMGIRNDAGDLICVGGVHVYSEKYDIAVIGNIATLPDQRKQGLGTSLLNALCKKLFSKVSGIGLNVRSDNKSAIDIYEKLGFRFQAKYHEWMLTRK